MGTWAGLSGSGSHSKGTTTMPSMSAKPAHKLTASALMNALVLANKSGDATGKLGVQPTPESERLRTASQIALP